MKIKLSKIKLIILCMMLVFTMLFPNSGVHADETEQKTGAYVQYNFNNHLTDLKNHSLLTPWSSTGDNNRSNASTSFGSDANGNYWQWHSNTARGGGFYIDVDKDIGEEYTIGLKFSFENTLGGWRKIIDYKNSTVDTGFYFYNGGHLNFYNYGVNGASVTQPNQVIDMIVRRNKNKQFEAYIVDSNYNKKFDMGVTDSSDQGVPAVIGGKTRLGFFFDDIATSAETSPGGKVYTLKIWDSYMDVDEVIDELRPRGYVNVHYVDEDGEQIIPDEQMEGITGRDYSVQEKTMYGFEYLRSEGDPKNGQYPDGEEYDVNLVYKVTLPYSVTARYVDEAGNPLCENIIYRGEDGEAFKTEQLEIKGYEFVRMEGNDTGKIKKHPQVVTYVYKEAKEEPDHTIGVVNVQYVNEDGTKIRDDIVYKGYMNTDYQTSQLVIPGYEFKQVIGNETGKYASSPVNVQYIYTKINTPIDKTIGGSVVVHYQDQDGNTIRPDAIFDGQIGDDYQVVKYDIPKYKFNKIIGEEKGKIEKNVKIVTVEYIPMASNVIARYVDENGNTIEADKIYSGGLGQKYQTEKRDIKGWKLEKIEGKETGLFSKDVQVIRYIYKRIGNVVVKYVDINGNTIAKDKVNTGYVGDDYSLSPLKIDSYELVRVDGNEKGKYQIEDQEVTYVYEKFIKGTVTIQCVDEKGNKILDDREIGGKVGTPYEINVPSIHGCEYIRTEGKTSGNYEEGKRIVKFIYKIIMPSSVTARYVDEDGQSLCKDIVYKGRVGHDYKTNQLEINGYEFVRTEGEKEGKFKEIPQLVTYVYKKKVVLDDGSGKVISMYVDEDGNNIFNDLVYKGKLGNNYKTSQLKIPGYKLKEVIGNEKDVYQTEDQEVKYVYTKLAPDEITEEDEKAGASVVIRYEDENGNIIKEDVIYDGDKGDGFEVNPDDIPDYEVDKIVGDDKGDIGDDVQIITIVYKPTKTEEQASTVIASYVDTDGNIIHFDTIYNGLVKDKYKTVPENIEGYQLVKVDGEESGEFTKDVKIVTYIYQKLGKVTIKYVDENGNVIKEETITGPIGTHYSFNTPDIEGYDYIKVEGPIEGYFGEENPIITFVYKKEEVPVKPNDKEEQKPQEKPNITINGEKEDENLDNDLMGDKVKETSPKTSDEHQLRFYMILSLISMLGLVYVVKKPKRKEVE